MNIFCYITNREYYKKEVKAKPKSVSIEFLELLRSGRPVLVEEEEEEEEEEVDNMGENAI